ncbi:hypothetical protein CGSMWGv00703Dmash_05129 [Gardnerella greenwoodii 00703Dmash]|uniref:Uncharacterized protein n=1 Tax=Gardnerella greenwoodii 00703Dmash TaxID=698960 RepID=I4M883_9BIFI|nr:hypothetical protein CGSMWGv00703Dmash_05129 [Gardnerella greenwoodii 00703Dmash]
MVKTFNTEKNAVKHEGTLTRKARSLRNSRWKSTGLPT